MRAPRFSLRLLFILTTLCAAVLGYIVWFEAPCHNPRQREQEKLCSDLEAMGFLLHLHEWEELPPPPFAELLQRKQGFRLTTIGINFENRFDYETEKLRSVFEQIDRETSIQRVAVELEGIYSVRSDKGVILPQRTTSIRLRGIEIDRSLVNEIVKLKQLKKVDFNNVTFGDASPAQVFRSLMANLPASVTKLRFATLDIPVEVAELVGAQGNVEALEVINCNFISADDIPIATIPAAIIGPHCKRLTLSSMMIDRPLCEQISRCKELQRLDIYNCILDGSDYQSPLAVVVKNLPASLEELLLPRCSISPTDLQSLAKLKSLRELTITCDGPKISHDDVRRLSKKLTALELDTDIPEQWLDALADHSQLEVITIHTDQKMPDTICDSILEINPKNFRDLGGMLSATAVRRLWDAGIEVNGPQQ